MRPATKLPCKQGNDATSYIVAMLLYMFEIDKVPSPQRVNRELARRPGEVVEAYRDLFLLWDKGMHVLYIGDAPDSSEEFLRDGIEQMRRSAAKYGYPWGPAAEAYWTPKRIAALQDRERQLLQRKSGRNKAQYAELKVKLTKQVLDDLLDQGMVVEVTVWKEHSSDNNNGYQMLVYGRAGKKYLVYDAHFTAPCKELLWTPLSMLMPDEGRAWSKP